MTRPNKSDVAFWAGVTICALALCCYAMFGCAKAAQSAQSLAAAAPLVDDSAEMQTDEQAASADEKAHQLVLDRVRAAVLVKVDEAEQAANAVEEPPEAEQAAEYVPEVYEYQESYYSGYTGGSTATTLSDLLNGQGRAVDEDGTNYTYYYDCLGDLDIPGEYKDENGISYDADGYIVVASSDHEKGTVLDTPYGAARVWDTGCTSGTVDIYAG